jgi:hypothetical protein
MRAILFSVLILSAATAAEAKDFRTLDFNAPCDDIAAREAQLGASPYELQLPSGFQYAFRAREMDRDVVIGYACHDGKFFRGAYIFDVKDGDDATALYTAIKRRVTRERGAPSYDFAGAQYRQKMKDIGATLSRADTQVAFWNNGHSEAHASVAVPSGTRGWRVSLSYTSEKTEAPDGAGAR